jgi:hypothetical protein
MDNAIELPFKIKLTSEMIDSIAHRVIELQEKKDNILPTDNSHILYTIKEVAEITGRCQATLYKHIALDMLIAPKIGKSRIVTYDNLNTYIKNGK